MTNQVSVGFENPTTYGRSNRIKVSETLDCTNTSPTLHADSRFFQVYSIYFPANMSQDSSDSNCCLLFVAIKINPNKAFRIIQNIVRKLAVVYLHTRLALRR